MAQAQGYVPGEDNPRTVEMQAGSESRIGTFVVASAGLAAIVNPANVSLIGADEQVDQNDYGASVEVSLGATMSGEILGFQFISTESGAGAVQTPAGTLLLLSSDPSVSAGDTTLGAANWPNVIGMVEVVAADWLSDTTGGGCYKANVPVAFEALSSLYAVWFHADATSFNDAGGDEEKLEVRLWIRRDT